MSSSDTDLENALLLVSAVATCCVVLAAAAAEKPRARGGSRPGKKPNRNLSRAQGAAQVDRHYFCRECGGTPVFSESEFERRFGVTRPIYESVRAIASEYDAYFQQQSDATGLLGATTDQKLAAGFRQLSMGVTAGACVDYLRTGESLNLDSLKRLTRAIVACFEETWLRPTADEVIQIEKHYSQLGFPGCIGAVDCASWNWDKYPVALQGQYKGKNKKPNCRMEVVCDDKLRIWHLMFGAPGAKNDKSILNQSNLFNAIRSGQWPPFRPRMCVAGFNLSWFYYLADRIYPDFCIFAKPHPDPRTARQQMYAPYQSSARKGVKRVFAVLFSQFEILSWPSRLHDLEENGVRRQGLLYSP